MNDNNYITPDKDYVIKDHLFPWVGYKKPDFNCWVTCDYCKNQFKGHLVSFTDLGTSVMFSTDLDSTVGFNCPDAPKVETETKELVGAGC